MTLSPTNVTIQGKRVWLQDAAEHDIEYVNYHGQMGLGLHMQCNQILPKAERIEYSGKTAKDAAAERH